MQTFLEFLHGDGWKKPLLPADDKVTATVVRSGQGGGSVPTWRSTTTIPSHQRLMLVLAAAGPLGISHKDLAAQIDLDGGTLNDLLSALVRSGEIAVTQTKDGHRVYKRLL